MAYYSGRNDNRDCIAIEDEQRKNGIESLSIRQGAGDDSAGRYRKDARCAACA